LSLFLQTIQQLAEDGDIRISEHGYDELSNDGLTAREIINGLPKAVVVEEYSNYPKGSAILLLQKDRLGNPTHAVWGIPKGSEKHSSACDSISARR
jgi:hypothetical protein